MLVSAFDEALRVAVERNAAKLLFDCREVIGVPTITQRFEMGSKAAELYRRRGSTRPLAAAMVVRKEFLDPNRFGQTDARNRGLMGLTTDDEAEALRFLESAAAGQSEPESAT